MSNDVVEIKSLEELDELHADNPGCMLDIIDHVIDGVWTMKLYDCEVDEWLEDTFRIHKRIFVEENARDGREAKKEALRKERGDC